MKSREVIVFFIVLLLFSSTVLAVEPPGKEPIVLDDIRQVRMKQENHESVVRIIPQPVQMYQKTFCSPVERARARVRELGNTQGSEGSINITAGHGEINVESNQGTINSDITVQVVNNNEQQDCL